MEIRKYYCIFLQLLYATCMAQATLIHKQDDQSGFISIDCGMPDGSNYTDPATGLSYVSDAGFIDGGVNRSISHNYLLDSVAEPYTTVRSFPQGTRNCYTLRPAQGKGHKYLIRAIFFYGNYDGKNQPSTFHLYLGADFWGIVNITAPSNFTIEEIVYAPSSDFIHVCLVKVGDYTPFVSALELRLLEDTMHTTPDKTLRLYGRATFQFRYSPTIRYKDDIYDRWWGPFPVTNGNILSTASIVDTSNATLTRPPPKVMSTAWSSRNVTGNLSFFWQPIHDVTRYKFYIFLHFAELSALGGKQFREFNIYLNGRLWYGPFSPKYLKATTIHNQFPVIGQQVYRFDLNQTASSTLPPIISAIEVFVAIELSESRTEDTNVAAMLDIKSTYKLASINWQGDPCLPQTFLWNGLNCSYHAVNPARIISLNLSSYGLSGTIAPSIVNLSALQLLDLSNNNLTGQIPEFLAELNSLKVLILEGNSFNGPIPKRLLEKSNNGTLTLSTGHQMRNTGEDRPNSNGKNMVVIPVKASFAAALLFILVVDL